MSVTIADVIEHVAWDFNVTAFDIVGTTHRRWVSIARYAVVWLARRHGATNPELVAALGCHKQSVIFWHARARQLLARDPLAREQFGRVDLMLEALA